ncbi:MAG: hypothetical protein HDKAJFGB_03471 [Anaerolineae bacterium]|nr:hypothetical protein [Anaerolineae bacterium]
MFFNRNTFAREHGFVHARRAAQHHAVHRHAFAGTHRQHIAHAHRFDRDFTFHAFGKHTRRLGRQIHQLLDRRARLAFCARFEILADFDERNNNRRCFKIHVVAQKEIEFTRDENGDAIPECRARAERNQQIHIRRAMLDGVPRAAMIVAPDIKIDRRGEQQHRPIGVLIFKEPRQNIVPHQNAVQQIAAHCKHKQRNRERQADD